MRVTSETVAVKNPEQKVSTAIGQQRASLLKSSQGVHLYLTANDLDLDIKAGL